MPTRTVSLACASPDCEKPKIPVCKDKKVVTRDHLIPQITCKVDLEPSEINIEDEEIEDLISDYTREAGARQLKRLLESLIQISLQFNNQLSGKIS